jgi:transcriptional/translational regulatory protein YebC/TACO1
MFSKKGSITVPAAGQKKPLTEDDLLAIILDAGADDLQAEGDSFTISTSPQAFEPVKRALEERGIALEQASIGKQPQNTVKVTGKDAENVLKLMEALEEHDDVQNVYSNFDIDEKDLAAFNG